MAQACVIMNQDGYPCEIPGDKRGHADLFGSGTRFFGIKRHQNLHGAESLLKQSRITAIEDIDLAKSDFFKKKLLDVAQK